MEENIVTMTGYHGTCSNAVKNIEKYGLDPEQVKYRDDHWLGQGVYFFEDYRKAQWWANDIAGKSWNQGSYPVIYQADIKAKESKILDLDNENSLDLFYTRILYCLKEIESPSREKYPIFTKESIRAVYFDYYKIEYGISVIMYTFHKDCIKYGKTRNKNALNQQKKLVRALGVAYKEKQICVSDKNCIVNVTIAYNGEDEVI